MRITAWRDPSIERCAAIVLLVFSWLLCVATTLTERVDRDEHMYLAAAALSADLRIYEDFAFLQTPYSVGIYRAVSALSPGNWTLLPARVLKILVTAGMISILFALLRRFGARPLLAAALITLLYQDDLIRQMAALARNYDFARLSVLCAMLIMPLREDDPSSAFRLAAIGILATAAVGFKLTYAPLALLLFTWPVVMTSGHRSRRIGWLAVGLLVGLVPMAATAIGVEPTVLRSNLLGYHFVNAEFHVAQGYEPYATIGDRFARTVGAILSPEHRPLSVLAIFTLALNVAAWSRPRSWIPGRLVIFVLAFLAATLVIASVPRPLQGSYFAPAFFGLAMFVAAASARLRPAGTHTMLALCLLSMVLGGLWRTPEAMDLFRDASRPTRWTGVVTHRSGVELASLLAGDGPVATTHPVFALEGGCELYPEFSTGEFVWRAGELLGPDRTRLMHAASAQNLDELLRERPPRAVVTEIDGPWDQPLVDWTVRHDWTETVLADPEIRAWTP